MPFSFQSRIRYSEVNQNRKLTLPGVVDYFQDCAIAHAESIGGGIDFLTARNCAWMLTSWRIYVREFPFLGDLVTVQTWPFAMNYLLANRNFRLLTEGGEVLAEACSEWALVDFKAGRAIRISDEIRDMYTFEDPLELPPEGRHIPLPDQMTELESIPVRPDMFDSNGHVNNCYYVRAAESVLPECSGAKKLRVEYRKQAGKGDILRPAYAGSGDGIVVSMKDGGGKPFVNLLFEDF